MNGRVLVVDDDPAMCELIEADLARRGCTVTWHAGAAEAFAQFMADSFDTVVTDLKMPGLNGIEFCHRLAMNRPEVPVIVLTAFGSLENAVEAIRAGAFDFVTKPVELDLLAIAVERALTHHALQEKVRRLQEAIQQPPQFENIIGESPAIRRLLDQLTRVAPTGVPVLITGESGTGKELVAKALHQLGSTRDNPFVAVNCAALPEALLESELFGHARGAFTDARTARKGLFLQAHGGTLFLDEIGEIPLPLQPKLLRTLEDGRIRAVGSDAEQPCDVRILAATNRDLEAAVQERRFREDLFFRINVVRLELPPLRSRGNDVLLLAQHFLAQAAARSGKRIRSISPAVARKLMEYDWPGNVRELRNAIESAVAMTGFEQLTVDDLPPKVQNYQRRQIVFDGRDPSQLLPLEDVERRYILHVLDSVGGNKSVAARILGLDRTTLYRKLVRGGDSSAVDR